MLETRPCGTNPGDPAAGGKKRRDGQKGRMGFPQGSGRHPPPTPTPTLPPHGGRGGSLGGSEKNDPKLYWGSVRSTPPSPPPHPTTVFLTRPGVSNDEQGSWRVGSRIESKKNILVGEVPGLGKSGRLAPWLLPKAGGTKPDNIVCPETLDIFSG